jgi:hypothetical protein
MYSFSRRSQSVPSNEFLNPLNLELAGIALEFLGALVLAREVWNRPADVMTKFALYRAGEINAIVDGEAIHGPRDAEVFVARHAAKQARIGFTLIAFGLGLGVISKLLEVGHR